MIPRLQTEQELEDPYAADEEYLREVIAQVSAPVQTTGVPGGGVDTSQFSEAAQAGLTQGGLEGVRPSYTKFGELGEDFQTYTPVGTTGDSWRGKTTTYDVYDPYGTSTGQQAVVKESGLQEGLETFLTQAAPLLTGTPLAPFAQAYSAAKAIEAGNIAGGIASLAGLGGYTDIANAARLVGAIENKDLLGLATAGMNLTGTKDIGGFTTKDITAANAVVQGLQTGNVAQALNGAAQLTDSPNVALAGAAVSMLDAAKSGNPAAMLKAGEALSGAINEQSRYYSKTDTGDETARLQARYGTADDALFKQIEAMSPTGTAAAPTTEDVQQAIINDVLRQSPTQRVAPAGTEVVQQAIQDDLNRELADIVYLNADGEGIKTQQEAAQQASQRGLPGFIFQGQTYRLNQAPGYLSPEGKLYLSEEAYVATLGPKTITIPGIQIAEPTAGAGRGISPGATASAPFSRIPLAGQTAAPSAPAAPASPVDPFVNPAVDFTDAATGMQGTALSSEYKPTTTLADIGQNLLDVRQNINQATNTGIRTGLSQLAGTGLRAAEVVGSAFGTAPERFAEPEAGMDELTSMLGTPPSSDAAVRDVQKELYDYQKSQLAALPNDAQRAFASGVASTVNTVASYALGGPFATVANAAANTGNLAWMQGKEAGLTPEDNAKRSAFMAGVEAVGELAGVPFLKALFKEMPMTGSKDALTDWLATKLKAYGGEQLTENLTTAGQFAVDKFADFGIPSQATDFGKALGETIIATTAAFGGTGAVGTFYGTPGLRTVTTQAPPTPIEFLGSTPATQIVPTEGLPQQLTYQPPAPPAEPAQITGSAAAAPAPEIFGPESQLGFEEGVRPTAQQQLEEALSGVYEPPAPPAPAPSVPSDTTGITPEMVAFIDEEGNLVTYGDLGFTAPAAQPAPQTAPQTQPATDAIFAEPQMDEINRLFQEVYQQQNYPVTVPAAAPTAAPTTALTAAPAQQDVIDLAPALTTAAPAQDLSAYQQALNQAVYGGTGEEPATQAPAPSAPATGTILSTDPAQGTALVVGPNGDTKVVDVSPDSKPGDTVNINAPAQDLSTPVATDPTTAEVIRLGDVTPSAPAPSTTETKTQAPAPSQAVVTTAAPSPAPSMTETKTEAPAPAAPSPAPAPTTTETKTQAPAPAPTTTEIKTEAPAPAPTETKTEAPTPAPTTTETKTEAPAPSTTETKTEAPAPAPTTTEIKTEAPAPTTTETKTEAPAPTTQAPTPAPPPSQPPSQPPAQPPAPAPTPAPPPLGDDDLPPVTEEELREIVSGPPPSPTPPPPAPTPAPPAPTPAPPAPTVKPPVVKPPSPAPSPAAQLAQVPGMTPELANLVQELMRTDPANLLAFTMVLQEEQEEKLEGLRGKLKSRKA